MQSRPRDSLVCVKDSRLPARLADDGDFADSLSSVSLFTCMRGALIEA
jgi:hypothetical protein